MVVQVLVVVRMMMVVVVMLVIVRGTMSVRVPVRMRFVVRMCPMHMAMTVTVRTVPPCMTVPESRDDEHAAKDNAEHSGRQCDPGDRARSHSPNPLTK